MSGKVEWIEISFCSGERKPRSTLIPGILLVSGRRCPRCNWLCTDKDQECFRCGYPILSVRSQISIPNGSVVEVEFSKIDEDPEPLPLHIYMKRMEEKRASLLPGFENLISLEMSNVERYEHQIRAVEKVLKGMRRAILADDPGLGKTIEAGLVTKELLMRSLIKSVLVVVPASLLKHWEEEMRSKFGLEFLVVKDPKDWYRSDMLLSSMELIRKERHIPAILSREYDLLIVDEAHKLRRMRSKTFKVIDLMKKKFFLLLTAMPIQNHIFDLYSLVSLLRPGFLKSPKLFRNRFLIPQKPFLPKDIKGLRAAISEIVIRTRKEEVGSILPPRKVAIYRLDMMEEEMALYERILELHRIPEIKAMVPSLQRSFCSSPSAFLSILRRIGKKVEGEEIERLRDMALEIGTGSKLKALSKIIQEYEDKFVIFAEHKETVFWIKEFLERIGYKPSIIYGGIGDSSKMEELEGFKKDRRFLICTSSGVEGIELHFCNAMVNFDIPWNPLMIEQRIGKIHRLGQRKDVFIFNLVLSKTIEEDLMDLLFKRLRIFELILGEIDMVLGGIGKGFDVEKAMEEALLSGEDGWILKEIGRRLEKARSEYERVRELENLTLG